MQKNFYTTHTAAKELGMNKGTFLAYRKKRIIPLVGTMCQGTVTIYNDADIKVMRKALDDYGYVPGDVGRPKKGHERRHKY